MQLASFSLWGTLPILLLFFLSVALLWVADRRLLASALVSATAPVKRLRRLRASWRVALAMAGGTIVAVALTTGALMLCLSVKWLLPVAALMALAVAETIGASVRAYMRSFNNTQAHRYYMLANGATLVESLMPSLRRAIRACVVPQARRRGLPLMLKAALLFLGLLMGGATPDTAAMATLLIAAAALVAVVMATLTAAFLLKKLNVCC